MRVTRDLPAFRPVTLTLESVEELIALKLALGSMTARSYERTLQAYSIYEAWRDHDDLKIDQAGRAIYHALPEAADS